jgi:DNA-binding transcriptional MerR regulator
LIAGVSLKFPERPDPHRAGDRRRHSLMGRHAMSELAMNDNTHPSGEDSNSNDNARDAFAPVENILSIENVAETFGISRFALRYCEFLGLVRRSKRTGSNWVYSWTDCDRIAFIIKCRKAGLRYSEIAAILRATDDESARVHETAQEYCAALMQRLETRRKMIDEAMSELNHMQGLIEAKLCGRGEPGERG